ncbi:hypothetical protein QFW82_23505 [Streptomyces malaysiensis subsp. malaysiensis]|uniref:helix-turn-helix transcriptional regulator n=1 Tax=Streptomyces malaysiensis TaxID=92644 RepID=UPI0024BFDCCC|nr:hypothetical protein [Streptomyces sp. NA07423]WHX19798.1 hypothetical protein QFW82_23505 [Streptomyces sp. NA07423]
MRRLDKGAPIRAAMAAAGLDIPRLAAKTGLSKSLIGFVAGGGKTAREECSDRTALLIAQALDVPLTDLFETPSLTAAKSTSTSISHSRGVRRSLPDRLMDQPELARWLKKSASWIDKQIQETKDLPEDQRFPVHYIGRSRRFDPREVLAHCDQQRQPEAA